MKVNAIVLLTRNFEKCKRFYNETLGLEVKETDEGFISFKLDDQQELALMTLDVAAQMTNEKTIKEKEKGGTNTLLATFVENTDKTYKELKSKGVEFIQPPKTQPWGQRTAYFKDPDGNLWEISHYTD